MRRNLAEQSELFGLIPRIPKQTIIIPNQIRTTTKINLVQMSKICSTVVKKKKKIMKELARMPFSCILFLVHQKKKKE